MKHDFYIAAPLFSEADTDFNRKVYNELIIAGFKCFLPQDHVADGTYNIFEKNRHNLASSRNLIAICDGSDVDSGTSWEIGYFYGNGEIYILRTDFRKSADDNDTGLNLMLSQSADEIFETIRDLVKYCRHMYYGLFDRLG